MTKDLSVIIPAYNEEQYIDSLIQSIKGSIQNTDYEIIVVDNGSNDSTVQLATDSGAQVYSIPKSTVAKARNFGATKAKANILAFLDADVRITDDWGKEIEKILSYIAEKNILTGSRYTIPENPGWLEKYWFEPLSKKDISYINGGNLILSKNTFKKIGGFNGLLVTAEDYEFSTRAISKGIQIINNPALRAIHDGYPKTLSHFCKREFWHGKGDCQSLDLLLKSNVSIAAVIFGLLHMALLLSLLFQHVALSGALLILIISMSGFMSLKIFTSRKPKLVLLNIPLCYLYLMSRFFSFVAVISGNNSK